MNRLFTVKNQVFLLCFFLLMGLASAQTKQEKADYYIALDGSRVAGELLAAYDLNDYEKIVFITTEGERSVFLPGDIRAFHLKNGRYFESKELPDREGQKFVQVLVSGELNLYKWKGDYFAERGDKIYELKAIQTTTTVDGKKGTVTTKQFMGVLNFLMAGNCGLQNEGNWNPGAAKLNDASLIRLIRNYHVCENIPYQVHTMNIPALRVSAIAQVGVAYNQLSKNPLGGIGSAYLDKVLSPGVEAGLRFHSLRGLPRVSMDLGVGYWVKDNTMEATILITGYTERGTEEYTSYIINFPFSVNYSLWRRAGFDIYLGAGGRVWNENFKSVYAIQDFQSRASNAIRVTEDSFVQLNKIKGSPSLKIGISLPVGARLNSIFELKTDVIKEEYYIRMRSFNSTHFARFTSLTVGFQFL